MAKLRAYRSGITAKAAGGVIDFTFDIITPTDAPSNPTFVDICPTCHEGQPTAAGVVLENVKRCPNHGVIDVDDHLRGYEQAKNTIHPIGLDSIIKDAKNDIVSSLGDKKQIDLVLVDWESIAPLTFASTTQYVLRVNRTSDFTGIALNTLDAEGRITVPKRKKPVTAIGQLMLDSNAKFMQLIRVNDMLMFRSIARPGDLKAELPTWAPGEAPKKMVDAVGEFLTDAIVDFDPEAFLDESQRRQQEWVESNLSDHLDPAEPTGMSINELEAQLQALRDAKKKQQPAKKSA